MRAGVAPGFRRRDFLLGVAAAPLARVAAAAERGGMPTVGWMSLLPRGEGPPVLAALLEGLADQGFVVSRTVRLIERYADGQFDRVAPLARELAAEGADVVVANGPATRFTVEAVPGLPVVYGYSGDPVSAGLADSLAKPRGKATGVTMMSPELNAKRLELLVQIAPRLRRIAVLANANHPGEHLEISACRAWAGELGRELLYLPFKSFEEMGQALGRLESEPVDALLAFPDNVVTVHRERIAALALQRRIPAVSGWASFAQAGGLLTYGPNFTEVFRRVGLIAARVLKGAKPADMPIEQPTRVELALNLRTAKAIDVTIPEAVLARADEVIE